MESRIQDCLVIIQAVPEPNLEIGVRGSGGRGGGVAVSKKFFSSVQASVWFKNKGGPPLDPPLPRTFRY